MTKFILVCLAALGLVCGFKSPGNKNLPADNYAKFEQDLVIHLYNGGGMYYGSNTAWIRYDSCVYVNMDHGKETRYAKVMTEEMRGQVMNLLKENRFYDLKSGLSKGIAHDKATTEICTEPENKMPHCVSSSATSEVREGDKNHFHTLYDALMEFAQKDKKPAGKKK